jgi:formylglycine-generating enzyme required for sulfatase activity
MRVKNNSNVVRRVLRGGSYGDGPWVLRCTDRFRVEPVSRGWIVGFRLVVRKKT